jgi:Zn-dependent protease with chaperone function
VRSIFDSLRCSIGWLIVPILGFMAIVDLASTTSIAAQVPPWISWVALGIAMVVALPILIRRIFPTQPIDEATRVRIESIVRSAGIRHCRVVLWNTGMQTHNAMIAGLLGRFRLLLLSDRLVADLTRQELSMVILHEVAHAKRFHVPLRIAALLPAWILGAAVERAITLYVDAESSFAAVAPWAGTLGSVLSILATILILRLVSYRSEYDADAVACQIAPQIAPECPDVPATEAEARRNLASALLRVTEDSESSRKPTWLHPGISDRIEAFSLNESLANL